MNKKLQIVQKYIFSTMLVMFAVLFIYSLIFATPVRSLIIVGLESNGIISEDGAALSEVAQAFAQDTSVFCNEMMTFSIIGLVLTGIAILYRSQIRKKYYITNLVSVGALIGFSLFTVVYFVIRLINYCSILNSLDLEQIDKMLGITAMKFPKIEGVGFFHYMGYTIYGLILVATIGVIAVYVSTIIRNVKSKKKEI